MTTQSDKSTNDSEDEPTIAITGAAGYIGSRVIVELRDAHPGWELVALDNQYRGQVDSVNDVSIQHVDIRNRDRLEDTLAGVDIVCHLAAISGVEDCDENTNLAYEVNVTGTNNVAWFCRKTGAGLVFPFSMAVLGDPQSFPITADQSRDPLNWYGRTKVIAEQAIKQFADGAFPAHMFLKSNIYGKHYVDGTCVGKPTVINFFVNRVLDNEPLTVYEPGTQARNFVHVKDVARVYVHSIERLLDQLATGHTGTETYEVATDEDLSILQVSNIVQRQAKKELETDVEVQLVENPRAGETMTEEFSVDTTQTQNKLQWTVQHDVATTVQELLRRD